MIHFLRVRVDWGWERRFLAAQNLEGAADEERSLRAQLRIHARMTVLIGLGGRDLVGENGLAEVAGFPSESVMSWSIRVGASAAARGGGERRSGGAGGSAGGGAWAGRACQAWQPLLLQGSGAVPHAHAVADAVFP